MVRRWRFLRHFSSCISTEPRAAHFRHAFSIRTKATPCRGFRAQRFYLNLLPVLGFLHHSTDLDEPDKPVTSVFLISQHRKSYMPSKNGAICTSAYLLCAQRFYGSAVFNRTFVQALIAICVADRSGTKVLCANFIANSILHRAQRFCLQR